MRQTFRGRVSTTHSVPAPPALDVSSSVTTSITRPRRPSRNSVVRGNFTNGCQKSDQERTKEKAGTFHAEKANPCFPSRPDCMTTVSIQVSIAMAKAAGVVFDQHYSDSLLRFILKKEYRTLRRDNLKCSRSLPAQQFLLNMALFGRAFLARPLWLEDTPDISGYEREDLVQWIPFDAYEPALEQVGKFVEHAKETDDLIMINEYPKHFSLDEQGNIDVDDETLVYYENQDIETDDAIGTFFCFARSMQYYFPLWRAGLKIFGCDCGPDIIETNPGHIIGFHPMTRWEGVTWEQVLSFDGSYYDLMVDALESYLECEEGMSLEKYTSLVARMTKYARALDSIVHSLAIKSFAYDNGLPISCSTSVSGHIDHSLGKEAYQLFRIQVKRLRYPVLSTVEDVLRLRDDPSIEAYRRVILEFSERFAFDLERGREKVFTDFHKAIDDALLHISKSCETYKVADYCFYLSIPLSILDILTGFPISTILLVPATIVSKYKAEREKKKAEWLMCGRPVRPSGGSVKDLSHFLFWL